MTQILLPIWIKKLAKEFSSNLGLNRIHNQIINTSTLEPNTADACRANLILTRNGNHKRVFQNENNNEQIQEAEFNSAINKVSYLPEISNYLRAKLTAFGINPNNKDANETSAQAAYGGILSAAYNENFLQPLLKAGISPVFDKITVILTSQPNDAVAIRVISHVIQLNSLTEVKDSLPKVLIKSQHDKPLITFDTTYLIEATEANQVKITVKEHQDVVHDLNTHKLIRKHLPNFKSSFSESLSLFGRKIYRYQPPPPFYPADYKDDLTKQIEAALNKLRAEKYLEFIVEINRIITGLASLHNSTKISGDNLPDILREALSEISLQPNDVDKLAALNETIDDKKNRMLLDIKAGSLAYNLASFSTAFNATINKLTLKNETEISPDVIQTIVEKINFATFLQTADLLSQDIDRWIIVPNNTKGKKQTQIAEIIQSCNYVFGYIQSVNAAIIIAELELRAAENPNDAKRKQVLTIAKLICQKYELQFANPLIELLQPLNNIDSNIKVFNDNFDEFTKSNVVKEIPEQAFRTLFKAAFIHVANTDANQAYWIKSNLKKLIEANEAAIARAGNDHPLPDTLTHDALYKSFLEDISQININHKFAANVSTNIPLTNEPTTNNFSLLKSLSKIIKPDNKVKENACKPIEQISNRNAQSADNKEKCGFFSSFLNFLQPKRRAKQAAKNQNLAKDPSPLQIK